MATTKSRRPWGLVLALVYLVLVALVWVLIRGWGDVSWFATVLLFGPRWVYAVPLVVVLPAAALCRRRRLLALAATGVAALLVGVINDVRVPFPAFGARSEGPRLRVMTYNIGGGTFEPRELMALIEEVGADVVGLPECGHRVDPAAALAKGYTVHDDNGACLITRLPVRAVDIRDPTDFWVLYGSGVINRYELEWQGKPFSIEVVHLETVREGLEALRFGFWKPSWEGPKVMGENISERLLESRRAFEWTARSKLPTLVLGDFNMPVESAIYREVWSPLHNAFSERGVGRGITKATRLHGIRIDHILYDDKWLCDRVWVTRDLGMDHRPLVADLPLRGGQ
jgi:endonuclease/exonuclease/phosphatase (EEP) superfamily protein YafD